jgi:folate-dependent phosphoribosylglycinamide formyltransferase PurN
MIPYVSSTLLLPRSSLRRVAVLISGTGTNMQVRIRTVALQYIIIILYENFAVARKFGLILSFFVQALIESTQSERSEASIALVISSRENARGLAIAERYRIPALVSKTGITIRSWVEIITRMNFR